MSDKVYLRQKYKEITGNANADDVPLYTLEKVVDAYKKGYADGSLSVTEELIQRMIKDYIADKLKDQKESL